MKSVVVICTLFLLFIFSSTDSMAATADTELVVSVKTGWTDAIDWPDGILEIRRIPRTDIFRLRINPARIESILKHLSQDHRILEAAIPGMSAFPPKLDMTGFQETLDWKNMIHLSDIQKISDGSGAVIALLDTGIDLENPDLKLMVWVNSGEIPDDGIDNDGNGYVDDVTGMNFGDNDTDVQDYYGHGTNMSSAMRDIAPGTRIMVLKINPGGEGRFSDSDLMEAIYYAQNNGANVISMSLTIGSSSLLTTAIQSALQSGCMMAAAAGNGGEMTPVGFPASMPETIGVGAMYTDTEVAGWISPRGPELDIMAPGVAIPVVGIGGVQEYTTGTSVSTAMISAVCAVIRSMNAGLTPAEAKEVLIHGVNDLGETGKDDVFGYGALDGTILYDSVLIETGQMTGNWEYTVSSGTPVRLYVNTSNPDGQQPVLEWFVMTGLIQGQGLPVYLFTGTDLVMVTESTDLARYVYPYDAGDVTLIAELTMSDLGLIGGEILIYAYAYSTDTGDIHFPEIVTIQVTQ